MKIDRAFHKGFLLEENMTAKTIFLVRPYHLNIGERYLLKDPVIGAPTPNHAEVTFVGYDNCPWFVYVRNAEGFVGRCSRTDLFLREAAGEKDMSDR